MIGGQADSGAADYVNFDSLTPGQTSLFTSGALSVSFLGDAAEDGPGASAPYLSGNNNLNFGSIYAGPDSTPYIATGFAGQGSLLFDFSSSQSYLGLLWEARWIPTTHSYFIAASTEPALLLIPF